VLQAVLVLFRFTGVMVFFPAFNSSQIPRSVKIGFSLSLAWGFLAGNAATVLAAGIHASNLNWLESVVLVAGEVLFGAGIGMACGIVIEPARIAGAYIGQEMGLNLAATTDPTTHMANNVVAHVFEIWAWIFFFSLDVHHFILRTIGSTFQLFPVGQALLVFPGPAAALEADLVSRWGLAVASPVGICLFVLIVALGLMMRAVPQLNIFAVGLAVRLAVGIVAMGIFLPTMVRALAGIMVRVQEVVPGLFRH
jgi:flagellar biosynthetic protein FliR